jgi:hypothetical protein
MSNRIKVFISYSHEDEDWLARLRIHLRPLERDYDIDIWDDRMIRSGSKWHDEIENAVSSAKVAVLLVSASFLASEFIATEELPRLLNAAEREGATVLPVIISPSRFLKTSSLSQFKAVNDPSRPLINLTTGQQEEIFENVANAVATAVEASLQPVPGFLPLSSEKDSPKHPIISTRELAHSTAKREANLDRRRFYKFASIIGIVVILSVLGILILQKMRNTEAQSADTKPVAKGVLLDQTLKSYVAYVTLEPTEIPRTAETCVVKYHVALHLEAPEGQQAVYEDRVKAPAGGTEIESIPPAEIKNTNSYPGDDSNLLEFKIQDYRQPGSRLNIEAVAKGIAEVVTPTYGKIGNHLPYRTEHVTIVVDFSRIGFKPPTSSMRGQREFLGPNGATQTVDLPFQTHRLFPDRITVVDHNVPAESSILLRWGTKK